MQEMLDDFELRKLVHSYCRAVDRGDLAHLRGRRLRQRHQFGLRSGR